MSMSEMQADMQAEIVAMLAADNKRLDAEGARLRDALEGIEQMTDIDPQLSDIRDEARADAGKEGGK